jgi:hypothetical protein
MLLGTDGRVTTGDSFSLSNLWFIDRRFHGREKEKKNLMIMTVSGHSSIQILVQTPSLCHRKRDGDLWRASDLFANSRLLVIK